MGTLLQDVRYGIRTLARSPGTTILVLVLLGVGIGANTSIFSLVNALYLKAVPVREPEQVVRIFAKRYAYEAGFSLPEYSSLLGRTSTLSGLAAETPIEQLHLVIDRDIHEVAGTF